MVGFHLRIVLCAEKDGERSDVQPYQRSYRGAERPVDDAVVSEARHIPAEDQGGDEPDHRRHDRSRQDIAPCLATRGAEAVDDSEHYDRAHNGDGPARYTPQKEDIGLEAVIGDVDDPFLDLVTEGDERRG